MNEKRFQITTNPMSQSVAFDEKEKKYYIGIELEDLLNEKESIISALKEENEQLRQKLDFYLIDEFEWKEKYGDY